MTEKELLNLIGDVRPDYIAQAEAFRRNGFPPKRKSLGVRLLSMAAVLAVLLLAGTAAKVFLAPNWKKGAPTEALGEMQAFSAETAAAEADPGEYPAPEAWQGEILNGTASFCSQDHEQELTLRSYTETVQQERGTDQIAPWRYAVLDMDGNGTQELVIQYRMEENGYFYGEEETLLLWKYGEKILGKGYYTRQMSHIRADGAFYWSGSSSQHGWGRLTALNGNMPGSVDISEDRSNQPEADWQSLDGGDEHSPAGPSPDELLRVKKRTIRYGDADGFETALETELFIGAGYSVYIPESGWSRQPMAYHGSRADAWVYDQNGDIRMVILRLAGNEAQAERFVRDAEPDWNFFPDKQGNLYGERDGKVMHIRFVKAEVETFVILQTYPIATYEGAGRMLSILADTFDRWPSEVETWYPERK